MAKPKENQMRKFLALAAVVALGVLTVSSAEARPRRTLSGSKGVCQVWIFDDYSDFSSTSPGSNACELRYAEDTKTLYTWDRAQWTATPGMRVAKVDITLAEMTGLRAANKTLVAAQGANTVIVPVSILFFLNYGSAAFTETTGNLGLMYGGAGGYSACASQFETTASWLVQTSDAYGKWNCDNTDILATSAQVVNTALTLDNDGDGEFGGGTGSTVTVWVTYFVADVS